MAMAGAGEFVVAGAASKNGAVKKGAVSKHAMMGSVLVTETLPS
jgi:hypothetical protein